jgi:hypothetical protein
MAKDDEASRLRSFRDQLLQQGPDHGFAAHAVNAYGVERVGAEKLRGRVRTELLPRRASVAKRFRAGVV